MIATPKSCKIVSLCTLLLLCTVLLSACGQKLKETSSGVKDSQGKKTYQHASVTYEPVELGKKHGSLKVAESMTLDLYRIKDLDPDEWLATEELNVLYADGVKLPTLEEMKPNGLQICVNDVSVHILRHISDADVVNAVASAWKQENTVPYMGRTPRLTYKIRFQSETYPALYFCVTYVEYGDDQIIDGINYGKYFLYSAFDGIFVPVGPEIHIITSVGVNSQSTDTPQTDDAQESGR